MAYLDSHGLQTLWTKIKSHFGKQLEIQKSATAVDIKLKNAASTPDVLSTITLPAAGTNNQAGVMTSAQAAKLEGIATGAEVNVQPNWDETDTTSDAYIRNKPVIPDGAVIYHNLGQNTDGAIDQKVVSDELNAKEVSSNKVTSWSATTTDAHYPSEKLVKAGLDGKVPTTRKVNGKALSSDVTLGSVDIPMTGRSSGVTVDSAIGTIESDYAKIHGEYNKYITLRKGLNGDDNYDVSRTNHTHSINGNDLGNTNKTSSDLGLQGENVLLKLYVEALEPNETTIYYSINSFNGDLEKASKNSPNITLDIYYGDEDDAYLLAEIVGVRVTKDLASGFYTVVDFSKALTDAEDGTAFVLTGRLRIYPEGGTASRESYLQGKYVPSVLVDDELSSTSNHAISNAAVTTALGNKVDKVTGKGLSTNDYTTTEKNKLAGIAENANNYVHPTTSGNKHIPSGGFPGDILGWSADGTAAWMDAPDTGVTKITAGSNVTISPTGGTGNVTINATDTVYTHPSYTTHAAGLYKIAVDNIGSVSSATAVTKSDITGLGIPAQDTTYVFNTAYNASTNKAATMSDVNAAVVGNAKYKGTLASEAALTGLTNYKQGNYWVISTGWTSTAMGITLDAGNMIFANADGSTFAKAKFDVIQADIEAIPDSEINALN